MNLVGFSTKSGDSVAYGSKSKQSFDAQKNFRSV